MIKYHKSEDTISLTIDQLREKLISLYKNNSNFEALCYILLKNNNKLIMENVINGKITLEECIKSNEYYITYIDIYLLSKEYDLPIILICNTIIDLTITTEKFILFNKSRNNKYFFIKNRSLYDRSILYKYKLLIHASSVEFNIDTDLRDTDEYELYSKIKNSIANFENEDVLGNYINNYKLPTKPKKQTQKQTQTQKQKQVKQEVMQKQPNQPNQPNQTKKRTRCPNGTHKNKDTGECEKYSNAL